MVLYRAALISESRIKNLTESFSYLMISGGRCRSVLRHGFSAVVLLRVPDNSWQFIPVSNNRWKKRVKIEMRISMCGLYVVLIAQIIRYVGTGFRWHK